MALQFIQSINENIQLAVWKVEEDLDFFSENVLLSSSDKIILRETHHLGKKLEFLAGRQLCQTALAQLNISQEPIYRNPYGKPEIPDSNYRISLSHTANYIALLIGNEVEVGIDIEKPNPKMARIAPRLFNEQEMEFCNGELLKYSKMWSAKEVLYKLFMKREIDFKEHLHVMPLDDDWINLKGEISKNGHSQTHQLKFFEFEEYYICLNVT